MHAFPTVALTFVNNPVRPLTSALVSLTPVPVKVFLDLVQIEGYFVPGKILRISDDIAFPI